MKKLEGKIAIITGGAQGIGGGISRRFGEEGASVLIADIDEESAKKNVKTIISNGGIAEYIVADVGKSKDTENMINYAKTKWGRIDILVNNAFPAATHSLQGSALEISEEEWEWGMDLLLNSIFRASRLVIPEMKKVGSGTILNISSVHGILMAPGAVIYETAKTAVIGLTKQLAVEYGKWGIRVNSICPGHIVTERIHDNMWKNNPSGHRFFEQSYPLKRTGKLLDIANAALFLCSDDSSFITGHPLIVDGGLSIQLQEDLIVQSAHHMKEFPDTELPS
tara:strand:- start:2884 stop:3723 length:840 start_codon:yes stop_codon:yes gene_type:complete